MIVKPEIIRTVTGDKLNDVSRYKRVEKTHLPKLQEDLNKLWKKAVNNNFVTKLEAKKTVGVIVNDGNVTLSTADRYILCLSFI